MTTLLDLSLAWGFCCLVLAGLAMSWRSMNRRERRFAVWVSLFALLGTLACVLWMVLGIAVT